eukprot:SAG31_NODE_5637_length_2411_cov_2.066609_4_plen_31_part_01
MIHISQLRFLGLEHAVLENSSPYSSASRGGG